MRLGTETGASTPTNLIPAFELSLSDVLTGTRTNGLDYRPECPGGPPDAHRARNRTRRRQHHLHLDPVEQASEGRPVARAQTRPGRRVRHAHHAADVDRVDRE